MTPRVIKQNIARLRTQADELVADRQRWRTTVNELYTADPALYAPDDIAGARRAIARIDAELDELEARIAALDASLPSADDVARAQAQADQMLARARDAEATYHGSWSGFLDALEEAERRARLLDAARTEVTQVIGEVADLIRTHGISANLPRLPQPTPEAMSVAMHVALLLQDVGQGCPPDATAEAYLADARRKLASAVIC